MPGPYYFAWVDPDEEFDPEVHNRFDEPILSISVDHQEGSLPALTISLKNPRVGLLNPDRKFWALLSVDVGDGPQLVFRGRLVGIPSDLHKEGVAIEFTARANDYTDQKQALATSLMEPPWWDELWISTEDVTPDTVLEARSALYHVDRTTLEVTISDILDGEDGVITVENALYNSVSVSYGDSPLKRIDVTAQVSWNQVATGEIDLSRHLWTAFRSSGSLFNFPLVGSLTSDGLLSDWPKPGDDLDGGWSMSPNSFALPAIWQRTWSFQSNWVDQTDSSKDVTINAREGPFQYIQIIPVIYHQGWVTWTATFSMAGISQGFIVQYDADRERNEKVTFSVVADVQPILVDPEGNDLDTLDLSSDFVDDPVDAGGYLPIEDLRRNCFFPTDRGQLSLQHLMLLARAKLRFRSRAVNVTFTVPGWILDLSCRMSVILVDSRLPGGQVTGKVTSYKLSAKQNMVTEITIGCPIGRGVVLPDVPGGTDVYATNYATGYTARTGAQVAVLSGELIYDPIDVSVIDDDGINFFSMTAAEMLEDIIITNGPTAQSVIVNGEAGKKNTAPDPIEALRNAPTQVAVTLKSVQGGPFNTEYVVNVYPLVIPKGVDLEAPSV